MSGIIIKELPKLNKPLLIAGFKGWGNALNIADGMTNLLIKQLKGQAFADLDPDVFYNYEQTRPVAKIESGILKQLTLPGGSFYYTTAHQGRDLIIMEGHEPSFCWMQFTNEFLDMAKTLGVETIITLGGLYDHVVHSERVISAMTTNDQLLEELRRKGVEPINIYDPCAIHSLIQWEGFKRGFECASIWCHCPFYLEGSTHYGLVITLANLLVRLFGLRISTIELEEKWTEANLQIQQLIEDNYELKEMIDELQSKQKTELKNQKVVNLKDFLKLR